MKNKKLAAIVAIGLMAALCYVGNYLQIKIPNGVLITRIHFGNSVCLLAGLLFGGLPGGLASGIGAGLYDLLDPNYILSSPFTFLSKFAMGFVCGYLAKGKSRFHKPAAHIAISAIIAQLVYIVLYVGKTYISQRLLGYEIGTALTASATNLLTSTINAVIAVSVSVPLYFALKTPLKSTYFKELMDDREESDNSKSRAKTIIVVVAFLILAVLAICLNVMLKNK